MHPIDLEEYVAQLETLVNIDSWSSDPAGLTRMADELEKWYRELGWHVRRHDLGSETGPLLETTNKPDAARYDVMFIGHMDTVFPTGTVAERPFRREGNKVYGPGVADMKNGDVAMYQIAKRLDPAALDKLAICMIYNPDEEIGSGYSKDIVDDVARRTDYCYVMEAAGVDNCHCFARKGRLSCTLRFHGQAGHAGFMFSVPNASAVLEMCHAAVELMALADRGRDTTVNVGLVKGGTGVNVVADYAELSMESRFWSQGERERILAALNNIVRGKPYVEGVTAEIVGLAQTGSWSKSDAAIEHMKFLEALAAERGIVFTQKDRGGLSDANHIANCGPICADGMGPVGELDHSEKEYGLVDSAGDCITLLCAALEKLAGL